MSDSLGMMIENKPRYIHCPCMNSNLLTQQDADSSNHIETREHEQRAVGEVSIETDSTWMQSISSCDEFKWNIDSCQSIEESSDYLTRSILTQRQNYGCCIWLSASRDDSSSSTRCRCSPRQRSLLASEWSTAKVHPAIIWFHSSHCIQFD